MECHCLILVKNFYQFLALLKLNRCRRYLNLKKNVENFEIENSMEKTDFVWNIFILMLEQQLIHDSMN